MKVKYFAWVRERVGKAEETVEPPANVRTIDDLIAWLSGRGEDYAYAFEKPKVESRGLLVLFAKLIAPRAVPNTGPLPAAFAWYLIPCAK